MQTEESAEKRRPASEPPDQMAFLSRLAGGLAHEIKNPLSTMSINLALLEEEWGRSRDPRRGEPTARETRCLKRLQTLQGEVRRLENIVEDFLRYARGGVINRSPCDLPGLVRGVLEFTATEDEQLEIRHHLGLPSSLPLVMLDAGMFRQALMNLVVNARQAMPSGGELIVRIKRRGNFAELTLTDTGVGMSEEDLERCFDIYWSTKRDGSGLGLATVRRIIEEHDGTIAVVSERGRGTSFSIVLPLVVEITHGTGGEAEEEEEG
ncbi:MAG: two-component sensor histidine kinase [Planctomycetes bacterium]|jgi:signal transduction histidine kinase|nr:two-component sensor histidine kinase [Planctomycetota bacterium]MDP6409148.1 ATP-binding protein [Planctomycetota bacterium]